MWRDDVHNDERGNEGADDNHDRRSAMHQADVLLWWRGVMSAASASA